MVFVVTAAISAIYDTVLDHGAWPRAIDRVRGLIDGAGGAVFAVEHRTERITFWQHHGLEPDGTEYGQHLHRINPRKVMSLADPPGVPCWDYRVITEREIDRHEFYDGIHRVAGVRYFIGVRPVEIDGVSLFTSVERTKKQGHVDAHDIALFAEIAPHYANAFRLAGRLAAVKTEASLFHLLDQHRDEGLILLDAKGRVIQTNADADRLLARNDGLWLRDRTLKAWKANWLTRSVHAVSLNSPVQMTVRTTDVATLCAIVRLKRQTRSPWVTSQEQSIRSKIC